jgi:peptidyl-prolyl cis-trans isomerase SurA
MNPGDISVPQVYKDDRQRDAVRIIYLRNRTEPHVENLKDDYNKIAQLALEQKKSMVLQKWFKEHISTYYVNLDKTFAACDNLAPWMAASASNTSR